MLESVRFIAARGGGLVEGGCADEVVAPVAAGAWVAPRLRPADVLDSDDDMFLRLSLQHPRW